MKHHIPFAIISAAALLLTASVAFAQTGPGIPPQGGARPGPGGPHAGSFGSTTMHAFGRGSTTPMRGPAQFGPGAHSFPGIVTSVAGDHFLMTTRGMGMGAASTTVTVNVTASTTFYKIGMGRGAWEGGASTSPMQAGSTTQMMPPGAPASLADVTAGAKVEVFGALATSTMTITADRVLIGNGNGPVGPHASTTREGKGRGLLDFLKGLFGHKGTASTTSGGPAAPGFLSDLMNALFGWMH